MRTVVYVERVRRNDGQVDDFMAVPVAENGIELRLKEDKPAVKWFSGRSVHTIRYAQTTNEDAARIAVKAVAPRASDDPQPASSSTDQH